MAAHLCIASGCFEASLRATDPRTIVPKQPSLVGFKPVAAACIVAAKGGGRSGRLQKFMRIGGNGHAV